MATSSAQDCIGRAVDELDTPALCIELPKLDANIERAAAMCRERNIGWRPHAKGHKCPQIARRQMAAGAIGVTCAKLGEAEVLAAGGVNDLLIANQIAGPAKLARLAELRRTADPIVTVDHAEQVDALARTMRDAGVTVRTLIEVDIGLHRAGVAPGDATLALARQIAASDGLQLAGIMGYEGHLLTVPDLEEKQQRIRAALAELVNTAELLASEGLPCPIVSAGGTGSFLISIDCPGISELQAGGLIFMDVFYREQCQVTGFEHALTILSTVVSRPTADRAIIDAGRKTMNCELEFPQIVSHAGIRVARLSAEHGQLELAAEAQPLAIGDRVTLIPGYGDFTTVLHNDFYVVEGDRVVDVWPLAARGRLA